MKIEYGAGAAFLYPITGRTGTPLFYALMLRNRGYTVMSNHHLRNKELTLKAKFMKLDKRTYLLYAGLYAGMRATQMMIKRNKIKV